MVVSIVVRKAEKFVDVVLVRRILGSVYSRTIKLNHKLEMVSFKLCRTRAVGRMFTFVDSVRRVTRSAWSRAGGVHYFLRFRTPTE